jgi:hypothetical protein
MRSNQREKLLKIVVGVVVGLFVLDRMVLSPLTASWKEQSERTTALREKVRRGRQLMDRAEAVRSRWADMLKSDLPDDNSAAEGQVIKGLGRWTQESRVNFTSLTYQWRSRDEGLDVFECRASASGDQVALARLLYELETDPLPARLEECELTARDAKGQQLSLAMRFSFARLTANGRTPR